MRPSRLALVLAPLCLVVAACGDLPTTAPHDTAAGYSTDIIKTALLDAQERTILDQLLEYPSGSQAQVSAAVLEFPPGAETGWHYHDAPLFVYVLEGTVTVTYDVDGTEVVKEYGPGDSIMEAVGTHHDGRNLGDVPVRLLAVNIGAEGIANTVSL
ncbi:MAG: hypothetical protein RLZ04_1595 [Actinomycetota bacterium]|jgi:quercetin dioxygenase-like cupin family protein